MMDETKGKWFVEQIFERFLKIGSMSLSVDKLAIERLVRPSEGMVLLILEYHGSLPMSDLAAHLSTPLSTMTSIAKRLESRGFIKRHHAPNDHRIKLVQLTEEGKQLVSQLKTILECQIEQIQSVLTSDELEQFFYLAQKIGQAKQQNTINLNTNFDEES